MMEKSKKYLRTNLTIDNSNNVGHLFGFSLSWNEVKQAKVSVVLSFSEIIVFIINQQSVIIWILDSKHTHTHKNILNLLPVEYLHSLMYFHWSAVLQEYTNVEHVPGLTGPAHPSMSTVTQVSMN